MTSIMMIGVVVGRGDILSSLLFSAVQEPEASDSASEAQRIQGWQGARAGMITSHLQGFF